RISDGVADEEQDERGEGGDLHALEIGEEVKRIGAKQHVIVEREGGEESRDAMPAGGEVEHGRVRWLRDRGLRQSHLEYDQKRYEEEREQPRIRDAHHQHSPERFSPLPLHISSVAVI